MRLYITNNKKNTNNELNLAQYLSPILIALPHIT